MRSRSFEVGLAVALSGLVAHGALAPTSAWAADEVDEADEADEAKKTPESKAAGADGEEPTVERASAPLMFAGIASVGIGSVVLGIGQFARGSTGRDPKGIAMIVTGGALIAVGVPLWVVGAQVASPEGAKAEKNAARAKKPAAYPSPRLTVGLGLASATGTLVF